MAVLSLSATMIAACADRAVAQTPAAPPATSGAPWPPNGSEYQRVLESGVETGVARAQEKARPAVEEMESRAVAKGVEAGLIKARKATLADDRAAAQAAVADGVEQAYRRTAVSEQQAMHEAYVAAVRQLEEEDRQNFAKGKASARTAVVILPTSRCGQMEVIRISDTESLTAAEQRKLDPSKVEQQVSFNLVCCLNNTNDLDAMECIDRDLEWLVWSHTRQARRGQKWHFGETSVSAAGATALLIGGTKAAESTTIAWSVVALAPIIAEEIAANGPRSQVHYAAAAAFARLRSHYTSLRTRYLALPSLVIEDETLDSACSILTEHDKISDKNAPDSAAVVNNELVRYQTYCKDYVASLVGLRAYRTSMMVSYDDMPSRYVNDAQALEGVFHKISFRLQAAPSKSFGLVLNSGLNALAEAIHTGTSVSEYKASAATFDLEKDGLALSEVWPLATPPGPLPLSPIIPSKAAAASAGRLSGDAGVEAAALLGAMKTVSDTTKDPKVLLRHQLANRTVAAMADGVGTYKMVFDFRAEKRTADIEFTRASDKK
ncbi:hypothetical protein [Phenylobacterium sp.]|uniref:hypothetical protein n=1 Tax=Phenylobacterium sp. TaxID=1871053 RepID=UPI0025D96505|nr:hypothetical protein [Phenylobacterium sp.]